MYFILFFFLLSYLCNHLVTPQIYPGTPLVLPTPTLGTTVLKDAHVHWLEWCLIFVI